MKYTLGTAAKATGKSKATIHRAIKGGVLSASRSDDGSYEIDPAELHRVYPPVSSEGSREQEVRRYATPEETGLLRQENDFLKQQLEREREFSQELSRRLDEEAAERRKAADEIRRLTLMITDQRQHVTDGTPSQVPSEGKGKLWEKLFGRHA